MIDQRYFSRVRAFVPGLVLVAIYAWLAISSTGDSLELFSSRVAELRLRHAVGRDPVISSTFRIFAFDDAALTFVGAPELSLSEWAKVIRSIDAQHPRLIAIDKIFAVTATGDDVEAFNAAIRESKAQVLVGAFVAAQEIKQRDLLDPTLPGFAKSSLSPDFGFAYGPTKLIASGIGNAPRIAHINIEDGGARRPFYAMAGGAILPSMPLVANPNFQITAIGKATLNNIPIPLDHWGRVPSSFANPSDVQAHSYSARALIQRTRTSAPISVVEAGDVVVILPSMFTGNTDFFDSPYGRQSGGYFLVSALNDALSARFPYPLPYRAPWTLFAGLFGLVLASFLPLARVLWITIASSALLASTGLVAFAVFDVIAPWLPMACSTLSAGMFIYIERQRSETLRRVIVDAALDTARAVQMVTIPPPDHETPRLRIAAAFVPYEECAGDWWHHFMVGDIHYVVVADATGHGISAALITTASRAALESLAADPDPPTPHAILERIRRILRGMGGDRLTTCCCIAAFDFSRSTVSILNAGLSFPLLFPKDRSDVRISESSKRRGVGKAGGILVRAMGSPLGLSEEVDAEPIEYPLVEGDLLVLCSDGVVEAEDPSGAQWGHPALAQAVTSATNADAAASRARILAALTTYRKSQPLADDVTLVVVEVRGTKEITATSDDKGVAV